jgi:hypothetical protein
MLAAGRKYMNHARYRFIAAGAVVSGLLGEIISQQIKLLEVASNSGYYRQALKALENGNISKAQSLLIGDRDSLYHEIMVRVGAHAALNFRAHMERVFAKAIGQDYN